MSNRVVMAGKPKCFVLLAALIFIAFGRQALSAERLVLVTPTNTVDTVISEVILREAYRRLGIDIVIKKYPGERAIRMANLGKVDGEVQRIDGINANYPNLIQIQPPINYIEGVVFSKSVTFKVDGWESLRPYRIGIIRGIKFAEANTVGMKVSSVSDYAALFNMLDKNRFDIIVSPRLNGEYQIKQLGVKGLRELSPSIMRFDLFHYLNKKDKDLVPAISKILRSMKESGELESIRRRVISVLLDRAEKKLPICDKDYACFENKPD